MIYLYHNVFLASKKLYSRTFISSFFFSKQQVTKPKQSDSILREMADAFDSSESVIGQLAASKDTSSLISAVDSFVSLVNDASSSAVSSSNGTNSTEAEKAKQAERMSVCFN